MAHYRYPRRNEGVFRREGIRGEGRFLCGSGGKDTLGFLSPCLDRSAVLRRLAEDEAEKHVDAPYDKKEEGGNQGEVVDVVRQDLS